MTPPPALDAVDRLQRDLRGNAAPFDGCPVLSGAKFRQISPVVRDSTRAAVVSTSVQHSTLWAYVRTMFLDTDMRADVASATSARSCWSQATAGDRG